MFVFKGSGKCSFQYMFFLTSKAASHRSWLRGWLRRCHLPCVNGDSCFYSFASFFSLWLFSPWVPVPKDRMFVLSPSRLKTAHVIHFLFSFSGHAFPLQWSLAELAGRWQCGHEGWWLGGRAVQVCTWTTLSAHHICGDAKGILRQEKPRSRVWEMLLKRTLPFGKHDWEGAAGRQSPKPSCWDRGW